MLVTLNAPIPPGQGVGAGRLPRFCAPLQASFAGAGPPLHVVVQPPLLQFTQEITAAHPAALTVKSDVKRIVIQPLVPVTSPGPILPVYVPISGAAVEDPLYTYRKS